MEIRSHEDVTFFGYDRVFDAPQVYELGTCLTCDASLSQYSSSPYCALHLVPRDQGIDLSPDDALCKGQTQLWFSNSHNDIDYAKSVCQTCKLLGPCREASLQRADVFGEWGGLNHSERRALWLARNPPDPSPHPGVTWNNQDSKWVVGCKLDGRKYYVGQFADKADAIEALAKFKRQYAQGKVKLAKTG